MNTDSHAIRLCMAGIQAEFDGCPAEAAALYRQAWDEAEDDYEACVAAHYVARFQPTPEATLAWNQVALDRANQVDDGRADSFYPSLYVNLGRSHDLLGHTAEAEHYYKLAADLGLVHQSERD